VNIPIIRLEFESMKQSLRVAMTEQMARMDADVQAAIDHYCTAENLRSIIDSEVRSSVNAAVKEEVQSLFRYSGAGRQAIREEIKKYADEVWGDLR
jgi:hypothetical protein